MKLSVVIPSHSRPDLLALCLTSVTAHAPAGTQVVVVDDGSAGGGVGRTARAFAGVAVVVRPTAGGFCKAANAGIAAAGGDIVELLNDNAEVTAGWADAALRCFADPAVGSVAPLVLVGPPHAGRPRIDSAGDDYDLGGFARKRGHRRPLADRFLAPADVFGASASSAFYRRSALDRAGWFPESFGAYFEDVDLAWRLRRAGYRARYEPASRVWHRVGSSHRPRRRLLEQQSRNEEWVYWRNVPGRWRLLPRHAAVLAGKALKRLGEGTLVPFAAGRLRAWTAKS